MENYPYKNKMKIKFYECIKIKFNLFVLLIKYKNFKNISPW